MNELVKAIKQFIYRDALFILGGSSVLLTALYFLIDLDPKCLAFKDIPTTKGIPTAVYILGAGFAFVVGYAVQDFFSVVGLVTTADRFSPNCLVKCMYKRFVRTDWQDLPEFDPEDVARKIDTMKCEQARVRLERIIALMQVGTTVGPCFLVSAVFLVLRWWKNGCVFDLKLALATLLAALVLIALGWLKAAQHVRYQYLLYSDLRTAEAGGVVT